MKTIHILCCALLLLVVRPAAAEFSLPDLGNPSSGVLSSIEKRNIGRNFMRSARNSKDFVDDLDINHYLNQLGRRLAANSSRAGEKFHFYVIKDSNLNAFAIPGGHITIYNGIINVAQSESELAAVLAHEIAHINRHHFARIIEKNKPNSVSLFAAILGAALIGGDVGGAVVATAGAAIIEKKLVFRREFEKEADALGIQILHASGFDPSAMRRFFELMQKNSRSQGDVGVPEYLKTHPHTVSRAAAAAARAAAYPAIKVSASDEFLRIKARIDVLYGGHDPKRLAARLASRIKEDGTRHDLRYGYAMTLNILRRFDKAAAEADTLLAHNPNNPAYYRLRADIAIKNNNKALVPRLFEKGLAHNKDGAGLNLLQLYYAEALNRIGAAARAEKLLRIKARSNRADPDLQRLYSRAAAQSGKNTESLQALAEYHYHTFDYRQALQVLRRAQKRAKQNRYLRVAIEARIKEIEGELGITDS